MSDDVKIKIRVDDGESSKFNRVSNEINKAKQASDGFSTALDRLKGLLGDAAKIFTAWEITKFTASSAMLSAKVETMGVVMGILGNNAGYTAKQMDDYAKKVASMGITTEESRNTVMRMAQAQLDLSKSADLARMAQDAAVIGLTNSSDALGRMIYAITTAQPEMLRTLGITVNFETVYTKAAIALHKNANEMTEAEKMQARLNAVMAAAPTIAGAYERAMGTAGKQMTSYKRLIDEIKLKIGDMFGPALTDAVSTGLHTLEDIDKWFKENKATVNDWSKNIKLVFIDLELATREWAGILDHVGGAFTQAGMLLYGPGSALGNKNSKAQFEKMAQWNMMYEERDRLNQEAVKKLEQQRANVEKYGASGKSPEQLKAEAKAEEELDKKRTEAGKARIKQQQEEERRLLALKKAREEALKLEKEWIALKPRLLSDTAQNAKDTEYTKAIKAEYEKYQTLLSQTKDPDKRETLGKWLDLKIDELRNQADAFKQTAKVLEDYNQYAAKFKSPDQRKVLDAWKNSKLNEIQLNQSIDDTKREQARQKLIDEGYQKRMAQLKNEAEFKNKMLQAEIELREKLGQISKAQSTADQLSLAKQQLSQEQQRLAGIDSLAQPEAWREQLEAITETQQKIADLTISLREYTGTFQEGMADGLKNYVDNLQTQMQQGRSIVEATFQGMEQSFSSFFFDAMSGKLKTLGDYWNSFSQSIEKALSDIMAQQVVIFILKQLGLVKEQGIMQDGKQIGTTLTLNVAMLAQVGIVNSLTAAYWSLAAAKAAAGAGGAAGGGGSAAGGVVAHEGGLIDRYYPTFHLGGLASDEVPSILKKKERVLSVEQNQMFERMDKRLGMLEGAALSGGGDTVNHFNFHSLSPQTMAQWVFANKDLFSTAIMKSSEENHPIRRTR